MSNIERVAIIGGGSLGVQIMHHISEELNIQVVGFYDDFAMLDSFILGKKVLGKLDNIQNHFNEDLFDKLILGIGYNHLELRKAIFEKYYGKIPFYTYISRDAYLHPTAKVGEGCVIMPGCNLSLNVEIGHNTFLYNGVLISHDSIIKSHNFFAPAVKLAGFVTIEQCCFIAISTTVIDNVKISNNIKTGAGSVVISDIDEPGLYLGTPAKKVN